MDTDITMVPAGEGSGASAPSSSSSTKKPKRFEIKKWNAVSLWAWGALSLVLAILLWTIVQFAGIISWISALSAKLIRQVRPARSALLLGVCILS
ncbi:unnamed protein product [Ilex paraguariensis]|uniref:Uncharacterized protein n=1 Tax=Ilex paraguariensis TaxID=185542 RepID=A0ABC8UR49_9AQUA